MGLDMYAEITTDHPDKPVDFRPDQNSIREIKYWRKHPNLHGWMWELYLQKGGQNPEFNCVAVALDKDDLDRLEIAVRNDELPETTGFFFGKSQRDEVPNDLEFISDARKAIDKGYTVFYHSWW